MTTEVLLDGLLAVLLVATILYAAILNRRLTHLRQGREELRTLIVEFTSATDRAHSGMESLRQASEISGGELKECVDRAQALRDDLSFLLERGTKVADRLVGSVSAARLPPEPYEPHGEILGAGQDEAKDTRDTRHGDIQDTRVEDDMPPMEGGDEAMAIPPHVKESLRKILEATR